MWYKLVLNVVRDETSYGFYKKTFQLIGTEGTRLLREKRVQGRPRRRKGRRGGSRTARGKRVPYVPINVILQTLKKTKKSINYDALVKNSTLMVEGSALPILKVCFE
jgi:hypothetical protein